MGQQISNRDADIAAKVTEIDTLKRDLQAAKDKADTLQRDLTGTQNAKDQTEKEKAVIADCLNKVNAFLAALAAGNSAAADRAIDALEKPCNEAEKYM
jgi:hypothetical protein